MAFRKQFCLPTHNCKRASNINLCLRLLFCTAFVCLLQLAIMSAEEASKKGKNKYLAAENVQANSLLSDNEPFLIFADENGDSDKSSTISHDGIESGQPLKAIRLSAERMLLITTAGNNKNDTRFLEMENNGNGPLAVTNQLWKRLKNN